MSKILYCPKCGGELRQTERALGCSNYKDGCTFTIWNTVSGHTLTNEEKEMLLNDGKTGLIEDFVSKAGKTFSAYLVLNGDGRTEFEFPQRTEAVIDESLRCPVCGAAIRKTEKVWGCTTPDCEFVIFKELAGHVFTDEEKTALIHGEKIGPFSDFYSRKSEKNFTASVVLENGRAQFVFGD